MDELLYEVSFSGQIQEDAQLEVVKARIAKMFKADEVTVARLFSGKRIVIKKNLTAEAADKYSIAFMKAGAICDLTPMPEGSTAPTQASDRSTARAVAGKTASSRRGVGKIATISGVAVAIVAGLAAATPYVTGMQAEQKYRGAMQVFEEFMLQQSGAYGVQSKIDYRRGWLSSSAINTITFEVPEAEPFTLELHSDISHGPLLKNGPEQFGLASIDTRMPLSAEQKADIARIWKGNPNPIQVQSHVALDGTTVTTASIAGFTLDELDNDPQGKLDFQPLNSVVTLSEQFTRAEADMTWAGMQLDTAEVSIVVGEFAGRSQKQMSPQGLWLGDDDFRLSKLNLSASEAMAETAGELPSSVAIDALAMTAHSEIDGANLVSGHTTITVGDVALENRSVASDLKLTLAVERLQAEALQSITQKLADYQQSALQGGGPAPGFEAVQSEVSAILAAGPVVKLSTLQATTEHGKVDANLEATIKVDDPMALQNPMFLLFALQAAGKASVPASLVETTPLAAFLPGFIEQGYITNKGGQLNTSLNFQQGQLTLNGKPLQP